MEIDMQKKLRRLFLITELIFMVMVGAFYFLAGEQLVYKSTKSPIEMQDADSVSYELVNGRVISQDFVCEMDRIEQIALVFTKFYREVKGTVSIELREGERLLFKQSLDVNEIPEQQRLFLRIVTPIRNQRGWSRSAMRRPTATVQSSWKAP